ncbi:hypothetical protein CKO11_00510 [Rhodobacter sp. TJ_12]|uniref:CPBP family intramembrane glutamic endopeptidase n=1 Tax=Rhodobacter sp. TJ_12 TaxID=2029399 RepID=UPI001CBD1519|nr:CPBP family intramembrane glutamic endopeptidase [Rhodobacter sp. TJ_12]MBZ4020941.1 hypothetical protein [Rhodobacter sp. TJ_12]
MTYPNLDAYIAPATARAEIWRSLVGLTLIAATYFAALFGGLGLIGLVFGKFELAMVLTAMDRAGSPFGLVMVLASFVPLALGTLLVTRLLHRRAIATLLGPGAGRDFARVFGLLMIAVLAIASLSAFEPQLAKSTPASVLLAWLPLAAPLLFVQIAAEELVFRGYLLQQIAARTGNRVLWMGVPAALFGLLHYAPGAHGTTALFLALWAMGFGLLAADLTARAGNLGPALAFHLANNVSAIFLIALYGQLDGLSLYTLVLNIRDPWAMAPYLAMDSLSMLVFWLLARLMLRR